VTGPLTPPGQPAKEKKRRGQPASGFREKTIILPYTKGGKGKKGAGTKTSRYVNTGKEGEKRGVTHVPSGKRTLILWEGPSPRAGGRGEGFPSME